MLDRLSSPTEIRLLRLVAEICEKNGHAAPLSRDANLGDAGLSSVDMVNLMLASEAEFDLAIPQAEISPENFRSIATMVALIDKLLGASQPH